MAKMYPEEPHPSTESQAERDLFAALKEQLSDKFIAFHSVAWQVRDTRNGVQDGETDFIVIDPHMDILIIEVKGGRITYDGAKDQWFSNNIPIKDPFKQGRRAKYNLLAKLKELPALANRWINIGYAGAFPDVQINSDIRLDAPRELIIDSLDINDLARWINQAFAYLRGERNYQDIEYSKKEVNALISWLAPTWSFRNDLARRIELERNMIVHLTQDQFMILDFLARFRRVAVAGCAGSGKTIVAVEKASRLARDGFKTLVLCHNPNLAAYLASLISDDNLKVIDFAAWIYEINEKTFNSSRLEWSQYMEPADSELDAAFSRIVESNEKYDAIIVDEGQDFRDTWWLVVEAAIKDVDEGILYIFYDDNQALYLFGSQLKYPIQTAPFILSKNCRNTGEIFWLLRELHPQAPEPSVELMGMGRVKQFICSKEDAISAVEEAVVFADDFCNQGYRFVVLTAEIGDVIASRLNGLEIELPDVIPQWQVAVRRYFPDIRWRLSSSKYPTQMDMEAVADIAREYYYDRRYDLLLYQTRQDIQQKYEILHWSIKPDGTMRLKEPRISVTSIRQMLIYQFFMREDWAKEIPKSRMRKIVAIEENFSDSGELDLIPLYSVASYKGLESDGIILFYWGHYPTGDKLLSMNSLYVGLSRAKHLLCFISPVYFADLLEQPSGGIYSMDPDLFQLPSLR